MLRHGTGPSCQTQDSPAPGALSDSPACVTRGACAQVIDNWESQRIAHPATKQLEYAKHLQNKPVL